LKQQFLESGIIHFIRVLIKKNTSMLSFFSVVFRKIKKKIDKINKLCYNLKRMFTCKHVDVPNLYPIKENNHFDDCRKILYFHAAC